MNPAAIAILATGPSMSQDVADSVRGLRRIAVNDAIGFAPNAEALCANDRSWWAAHPDAKRAVGRKFSTNPPAGVEKVAETPYIHTGTNSSLLALHVAITVFAAREVLLYGLDLSADRGHHFAGARGKPRNTPPSRFRAFIAQFDAYPVPDGVAVLNATPRSALTRFPVVA